MKGWQSVRIGDVCEIKPSKRQARAALSDSDAVSFAPMSDLGIGQKYLSASDERPLSKVAGSYTYFADGDVLLAKITPCFENGKLSIARDLKNGVGFGSSEFMVIRPGQELLPEYLYYFLDRDELRQRGAKVMTGAVGHKRVPQEFVEALDIPLPPLDEQRRIVAVLDEAFIAIAIATANAEKNLANARELFSSYLRQAGARSTARKAVRIGECATVVSGQHIDARDYNTTGQGIGYLTGPSDFGETFPTVSKWTLVPKRTALPGDILITVKGSGVGSINMMGEEELAISRQLMAVRATHYPVELLYFALEAGFDHFQRIATGAAIPGISRTDVLEFEFAVPDDDEIDQFLERLSQVRQAGAELAEKAKAQMAKLAALKQSLLHRAFSGQLTEREPLAA